MGLAISSISDKTILTKLITEILKHSDITIKKWDRQAQAVRPSDWQEKDKIIQTY